MQFRHPHHVTYIVYNIREVAEFMYMSFGMKPWRSGDYPASEENRGFRTMIYRVGDTMLDFSEPYVDEEGNAIVKGGAADLWATQLRGLGPGIFHVAWAVEQIDDVVQELLKRGNTLDARHNHSGVALHDSYLPFYKVCNVLPESVGPSFTEATRGQFFQVAEGVPSAEDLADTGNFYVNVRPLPSDERAGPELAWRGVHHVTYVVYNVREVADFLEKSFDMLPSRADEFDLGTGTPAARTLLYVVGDNLIEVCEPVLDDHDEAVAKGTEAASWAKMLREAGPGILNVGWTVDDIDQVYDHLLKVGIQLDEEVHEHPLYPFYRRLNISSASMGSQFGASESRPLLQLAEGQPTAELLSEPGNLNWRDLPERSTRAPGGTLRLPVPQSAY